MILEHSSELQQVNALAVLATAFEEQQNFLKIAISNEADLYEEETVGPSELTAADCRRIAPFEESALIYWMGKIEKFKNLSNFDKRIIFNRYKKKKMSLDHVFLASKHKFECMNRKLILFDRFFTKLELTPLMIDGNNRDTVAHEQ
uniref:NR LBD domain-containing protein n=1 Tax=Caenorhabditis tropicalis TaxID=1561998 RepID=A0A1I7ULG5_9PELO